MPLPARKTPRIVSPQKIKAWGNLPREEQMIDWSRRFAWTSLAAMTALMVASSTTAIAQECKNRGQLDTLYCDENNDLVADVPTDPKKLRDPSTLVFAYTPGGGPGGLSERFQAAHRFPGSVHRQAGSLLPGAIELGRDRGDALGPPPCRGLLDRTDADSPSIWRERFRSPPRAPRKDRMATISCPSSRRTAPTRSSPI